MTKLNVLPEPVVDLLLSALRNEFKAFYFYRNASNWFKNNGFKIASEYFFDESQDELKHAKIIEQFLVDWNVMPILDTVKSPENIDSFMDIIDKSYKMEYELYELYEQISIKIFEIGDICAFDFLQQFRNIQKESVANYSDIINMLNGINESNKFALLSLEEKIF